MIYDSSAPIWMWLFVLCLLFLACVTVWAGIEMSRLRRYRFAIAGSIAVMPVSAYLFGIGIPIGIWAIVILLRPEVRSSFSR